MIIKSPEDLKSAFLCFCVFHYFNYHTDEEFIDQNPDIVNPYPFITWMVGKGYISNREWCEFLEWKERKPFGSKKLWVEDFLRGDYFFPNTNGMSVISIDKGYSLLAEYMSILPLTRQRLYDVVNDKASCMYNNQFYKNEDGISLACIINDNDLISVKSYPEIMMLDETGYGDLSLRDRFDFVRQISISASNKLLK